MSCSSMNQDNPPPQNLLGEEVMVEALVATHILEQQVNGLKVSKESKKDSFQIYQQRIFERLSIDSASYYGSYDYYTTPSQVGIMYSIMTSVTDSLGVLRSEVTPNRN